MSNNLKAYLGDGVYVDFDERLCQLILTVEDGVNVLNKIYLEPSVFANLLTYRENLKAKLAKG